MLTEPKGLTEDEAKQFLKNEERLWDMAALTIASALVGSGIEGSEEDIAVVAYSYSDALMKERRKRLAKPLDLKMKKD